VHDYFAAFDCYITRHWIAYTTIDIDETIDIDDFHGIRCYGTREGHAEKNLSRAQMASWFVRGTSELVTRSTRHT